MRTIMLLMLLCVTATATRAQQATSNLSIGPPAKKINAMTFMKNGGLFIAATAVDGFRKMSVMVENHLEIAIEIDLSELVFINEIQLNEQRIGIAKGGLYYCSVIVSASSTRKFLMEARCLDKDRDPPKNGEKFYPIEDEYMPPAIKQLLKAGADQNAIWDQTEKDEAWKSKHPRRVKSKTGYTPAVLSDPFRRSAGPAPTAVATPLMDSGRKKLPMPTPDTSPVTLVSLIMEKNDLPARYGDTHEEQMDYARFKICLEAVLDNMVRGRPVDQLSYIKLRRDLLQTELKHGVGFGGGFAALDTFSKHISVYLGYE